MIVCICRSVSDRTIDAAIGAGARSLVALAAATGAGTVCGCCRGALEARLEAAAPCSAPPCVGCPRAAANAPARVGGGAPATAAAKNDEAEAARAVA